MNAHCQDSCDLNTPHKAIVDSDTEPVTVPSQQICAQGGKTWETTQEEKKQQPQEQLVLLTGKIVGLTHHRNGTSNARPFRGGC